MLQDVLDNLHGKENKDEIELMEHNFNKFNKTKFPTSLKKKKGYIITTYFTEKKFTESESTIALCFLQVVRLCLYRPNLEN